MKLRWNTLGGQLGVVFCLAGLALIWAGWNGAAATTTSASSSPT